MRIGDMRKRIVIREKLWYAIWYIVVFTILIFLVVGIFLYKVYGDTVSFIPMLFVSFFVPAIILLISMIFTILVMKPKKMILDKDFLYLFKIRDEILRIEHRKVIGFKEKKLRMKRSYIDIIILVFYKGNDLSSVFFYRYIPSILSVFMKDKEVYESLEEAVDDLAPYVKIANMDKDVDDITRERWFLVRKKDFEAIKKIFESYFTRLV